MLNELKKEDHEPHHLQKQKCPTLIQVRNNLKRGSMVEVIMDYLHFSVSFVILLRIDIVMYSPIQFKND